MINRVSVLMSLYSWILLTRLAPISTAPTLRCTRILITFICRCLQECPHNWLVTYNIDDELKEAYKDFNQEEFKITYGMKHRADNKLKTELLVTNFTESTPLASLYETV